MEGRKVDILERIHASYYQLTATEKKVADYVTSNSDQVQYMSITQLADECGTAEATISRFCKSLGLKGFNAFKIELARDTVYVHHREAPHSTDTLKGRCQEIGRQAIAAIQQTMELVDSAAVDQVVTMLQQAPRVLSIGSGGSMVIASECAHVFSTVTGKVCAVADSHMQMSAIATLEKGSVVLLFSYSGATKNGMQVLELAKSRGIQTVLVTRFSKSPAAKLADVVLQCGSQEDPFQFGSMPAKIAQLMVINVIFQEYVYRNREECEENIQAIASALSDMHI